MFGNTSQWQISAVEGRSLDWYRRLPKFAIALFALAIAAAYLPNILFVFGIQNDYNHLYYKSPHFIFPEASWLFFIARPVGAVFTNLTLLPIDTVAGLRWYRLFAILTVIAMGVHLITILTKHLRLRGIDALAVAACVFLAPGLAYSMMNASSWVPFMGAIWLGIGAYAVLSKTNARMVAASIYWNARDSRCGGTFLLSYARSKPVLLATLLLQLSLYDYPPTALVICVFPVVVALFAESPLFYRIALCIRDLCFIAANVVVYLLSVKFLYFPLIKSLYSFSEYDTISPEYQFGLVSNAQAFLHRLLDIVKVGSDLWFLPQYHGREITLAAIVLTCALAAVARFVGGARHDAVYQLSRIRLTSTTALTMLRIVAIVGGFLIAASPVIASSGGFASYRTIIGPTAIVEIVFVFCLRTIFTLAVPARLPGTQQAWRFAGDAAAAVIVAIAVGVTTHHMLMTITLARNEFAYVEDLIRHAQAEDAATLVVVDPRESFFPEQIPVTYDEQRRPIVPYELGCFSMYCFASKAIFMEAVLNMGMSVADLHIEIFRGDSAKDLSCADFATRTNQNGEAQSIAALIAARGKVDCVNYTSVWRDLSFKRPS